MTKAKSIIISVLLVLVTICAGVFTFASFPVKKTKKFISVLSSIDVGAELSGAYRVDYSPAVEEGEVKESNQDKCIEIVRKRLNIEEFGSATVYKNGNGFSIEFPKTENVGTAYSYFGSKGVVSLYIGSSATGTDYFDYPVADYSSSPFIKSVSVSEAYSQDGIIYSTSGYSVVLEFTKAGREQFRKATKQAASASSDSDKVVTFFLDGEYTLSQATVSEEMDTDTIQISGNFTKAQAQIIESVIKNGVMPVKYFNGKVVENKEVDGEQYIISSVYSDKCVKTLKISCLIALAVFLIAMAVVYKGLGILADFSAIFSVILFVLVYAIIPGSVFTMSSVLGAIMSFFVYVVGSVVFFELIKKEFHNGKTLNASIGDSFKKVMWLVLDIAILAIITFFSSFFFASWAVRTFVATFAVGTLIAVLTFSLLNRGLIALFKSMVNQGRFYHLVREEADDE